MDKNLKVATFKDELNYIKNEEIKMTVIKVLENVPDYFFDIPASSTGKYHPSFSLGDGGLVRHTKIAVRIAYDLFTIVERFNTIEKDCIIASLILHDCCKSGFEKSNYTKHEHPILACKLIDSVIENQYTNLIKSGIASHMGKWNTNIYSEEILPKPSNAYEKFIHTCDYLASRKFFDMFN